MPRIRSIKPEFWSHIVMGRLDDATKCVAIALLNFADDSGYFQADPILVRNFARPFDDDSTSTRRCLARLEEVGWIQVSETENHGEIGRVTNFVSHQKIDRPTPSRIDKYFDSSRIRRGFVEPSLLEGKGREGDQGKEGNAPASISENHESEESDALFSAIRKSFQDRNPLWSDPKKQVEALEWLVGVPASTMDQDSLLTRIEKFWRLTTESSEKFWRQQPFTPATMRSLWGHIEKAEIEEGPEDLLAQLDKLEKQRQEAAQA